MFTVVEGMEWSRMLATDGGFRRKGNVLSGVRGSRSNWVVHGEELSNMGIWATRR